MEAFITIICSIVLLGIAGGADTTLDTQKNVSGVPFMEETEQVHSHENITEEIFSETDASSEVPCAPIPAIMIDGTIYYLSQGFNIPDEEINTDQIYYTKSLVSACPEKDGESNYALEGTPYVKYGNGYALKIDKYGWTLFLTWEERLIELHK